MAFRGSGAQQLANEDGLPQVSTSGGTPSGGWSPFGGGATSTRNPNWVSQYYPSGSYIGNASPTNVVPTLPRDTRPAGGFMGPSTTLRDDSPYNEIGFRNGPVGVRPLGNSGQWNPGPSNIGSFFSGPMGGYYPSGINYSGAGTAYPTTWTRTPGVNGGAVPRAQVNGGSGGSAFGNNGLGSGNMFNVTSAFGLMGQGSGALNSFIRAHASH